MPQLPQPPFVLPHAAVSVSPPEQLAPPHVGAGSSQARVRDFLQLLQAPKAPHLAHPPATGQQPRLQAALLPPVQPSPSCAGAGLSHARVLVPGPQLFEHSPHFDHTP